MRSRARKERALSDDINGCHEQCQEIQAEEKKIIFANLVIFSKCAEGGWRGTHNFPSGADGICELAEIIAGKGIWNRRCQRQHTEILAGGKKTDSMKTYGHGHHGQ